VAAVRGSMAAGDSDSGTSETDDNDSTDESEDKVRVSKDLISGG
jgi:hypothetical protein